jgi:hypothetical protein
MVTLGIATGIVLAWFLIAFVIPAGFWIRLLGLIVGMERATRLFQKIGSA